MRERLKTLQMGQTLEQFAERCDMPSPTLRRHLTGERTPEAGQLQMLAERLHVSMDWLMAGKMAGGDDLTDEQIDRLCSLDQEVIEVDSSSGRAIPVMLDELDCTKGQMRGLGESDSPRVTPYDTPTIWHDLPIIPCQAHLVGVQQCIAEMQRVS